MPAEAAPSFLLVADLPDAGGQVALPEREGHYLTRVCRARPGDRASATDGRGALATVRLLAAGRAVTVEVERCDRRAPTREAWVLAGPPEGERGDWLVEKLGELGVGVLQPLDCERGRWAAGAARMSRWRRVAVAALRQARRRFLLEVRDPRPIEDVLAGLPSPAPRWLADPEGRPASRATAPGEGLAVGLIGPAGGFSRRERDSFADQGFARICLSDSRLRTETAAMAWACWWAAGRRGPAAEDPSVGGLDAFPARP